MAGNNKQISGGGIHHVAMNVRNFDKTVKFYTEGLGFKIYASWEKNSEKGALLDTGDGTYFEVFEKNTDIEKQRGTFIHTALRTSNCDEAFKNAVNAGAAVKMEPTDVTINSNPPMHVRIAFCIGPDGEEIEFFQDN